MCGIAATSAQSGTKRYILAKTNRDRTYLRVFGSHLAVATDNEVILCWTINGQAFLHKRKGVCLKYFKLVMQGINRHEDSLQIMVTIFALAQDTQAKINLAVRVKNHTVSMNERCTLLKTTIPIAISTTINAKL